MFKFNLNYFLGFLLLLITEILIAIYAHDNFVRPFLGDFLVVILLFCFVKSFVKSRELLIAFGVLLFSYIIEFAQYFEVVSILGLAQNKLANIIIGNYFSVIDLLMYTLGITFVLVLKFSISKSFNIE